MKKNIYGKKSFAETIELKKRGKNHFYAKTWVSPNGNVWAKKITLKKAKISDLENIS